MDAALPMAFIGVAIASVTLLLTIWLWGRKACLRKQCVDTKLEPEQAFDLCAEGDAFDQCSDGI